jgi:hypothetical protein
VLVISFIGVTILLLSTLNQLQQSNYVSQFDEVPTGLSALAGVNYTMLYPYNGWPVTWNETENSIGDIFDQSDGTPDSGAAHLIYNQTGKAATDRGAIWAFFVRNNSWNPWTDIGIPDALLAGEGYEDMVIFAQKYAMHGWFDIKVGVNWRWTVIPYQSVLNNQDHNISRVSFLIGGENMTAFFLSSDESHSFEYNLYTNNSFTMALGDIWWNDAVGKQSMWKLVGQLLTCSLPDTNFYINAMMTIAIWSVIVFVAVAMISRFIPTIPGL